MAEERYTSRHSGQEIDDAVDEILDKSFIVNDLISGGTNKALSAEMGRELADMIDDSSGGTIVRVVGKRLVITSTTSPQLSIIPSSMVYEDTIFGQTLVKQFTIRGKHLTEQVEVSLVGAVGFTKDVSTITPDADGKVDTIVNVTFAPTTNTGEETQTGIRTYGGTLVASGNDISAEAVLSGTGVEQIIPIIIKSIDKNALKGVLSSTASGDYTDAPSKATLHIVARNIDTPLTLSVDSNKFALSVNQISVDDAQRGVDVEVSYVRQSAATETPDSANISIVASLNGDSVTETIAITGETAAKVISGTIGTFDSIEYSYSSSGVMVNNGALASGAVVIPEFFYDDYGYKYIPSQINGGTNKGFTSNANITSVIMGSNINTLYGFCFQNCTALVSAKFESITEDRAGLFKGCSSLESVDFITLPFTNRNYVDIFIGCTKLSKVIIRSTSMVTIGSHALFDEEEVGGSSRFYYIDGSGNHQQKRLYVPLDIKSAYEADPVWSKFDIHAISELES